MIPPEVSLVVSALGLVLPPATDEEELVETLNARLALRGLPLEATVEYSSLGSKIVLYELDEEAPRGAQALA